METNIFLSFKIGRGGRFYNGGHLSLIGEGKISDYTDDLFLKFENEKIILEQIGDRENLLIFFEKATEDPTSLSDERNRLESIGFDFGKLIYVSDTGREVGLTYEDAETGVGCINYNDEYNSIYATKLEDLEENELELLINENETYFLKKYATWFGYDETAIQLMSYFKDWYRALIEKPDTSTYIEKFYVKNEDVENEDCFYFKGKFYHQ